MKIRVFHAYFGCDSGCCGHRIEVYPDDDDSHYEDFEFGHSDKGREKEYARELAENFLKRHHPECLATIDWDSLEYEVVAEGSCIF